MLVIGIVCSVYLIGMAGEPSRPAPLPPSGNSVIRGKAGSSEIVITTTDRLAGAIHSLVWNGKEFIDSFDHGRQLQSAAGFDCARPGEFWSECFNPTEAGSRADGMGNKSSSKLLSLQADGSQLQTTTQMAFWLAPGEQSSGRPALNDKVLSQHVVSKRVRIGHGKLPNVIEYDVTFSVPQGERHTYAQFEALTGYMPPDFSRFWKFQPDTGKLEPLDDGPGEQSRPVVFATETGAHAMGIFSPDQPSKGWENAGYGRFRFKAEKVVKWNCVFRTRNPAGIAPGDYRYRMFVAVGTLDDVRLALGALVEESSRRDDGKSSMNWTRLPVLAQADQRLSRQDYDVALILAKQCRLPGLPPSRGSSGSCRPIPTVVLSTAFSAQKTRFLRHLPKRVIASELELTSVPSACTMKIPHVSEVCQ